MANGDDPQDHLGALDRIARSLGVPATTFMTADPPKTSDIENAVSGLDHLPEVIALLRLFVRLKSPEARARCLTYIAQEATKDG